jgi:hypothetical protein
MYIIFYLLCVCVCVRVGVWVRARVCVCEMAHNFVKQQLWNWVDLA